MKKILFVINSLTIGGSEKSLVSLLNLIDYSKYDVDLMMFKSGKEFDKYIPDQVKVLEEPKYYKYISGNKKIDISIRERIKYSICRYKTSIALRVNSKRRQSINSEQVLYKNHKNVMECINENYDIAIAYSQGMPTYFIIDNVKAKKKIAWINCDYATTIYDKEFDYNYYKEIDKIIVVSQTIKESIINLRPDYKNKLEVILDIVDPYLINKMSIEENEIKKSNDFINILTVGRLVIHHKGYDLAIEAAKKLKDRGYNFKWYVIGEGPDRKEIENMISRNGLNNSFILLGKRDNPYPYMRSCDIYVQPSRKEGFGLTAIEAKILKKAMVCTNFNTAKELINDKVDGLIVNINSNDLCEGIVKYIEDNEFKNNICKNLNNTESYSSIKEMDKIYNLFKFNNL